MCGKLIKYCKYVELVVMDDESECNRILRCFHECGYDEMSLDEGQKYR